LPLYDDGNRNLQQPAWAEENVSLSGDNGLNRAERIRLLASLPGALSVAHTLAKRRKSRHLRDRLPAIIHGDKGKPCGARNLTLDFLQHLFSQQILNVHLIFWDSAFYRHALCGNWLVLDFFHMAYLPYIKNNAVVVVIILSYRKKF